MSREFGPTSYCHRCDCETNTLIEDPDVDGISKTPTCLTCGGCKCGRCPAIKVPKE